MAVALHTKNKSWSIGTGDFLGAFFDTIAVNLEDGRRGKKFPCLGLELYIGSLPKNHLANALKELEEVEVKLAGLPPEKMVWDMEAPDRQPPWGSNISPKIKNLRDYFVTGDGNNLIDVLREALNSAAQEDSPLAIR